MIPMKELTTGRIVDEEVYESVRQSQCEVCGALCENGPHHIKSRGAGGSDVEENLIQLCMKCHRKAHDGSLDSDWLRRIALRRIQNKTFFGAMIS